MVAIYHADYNFYRVHQTLRVTPAMEAGLTDHVYGGRDFHYRPERMRALILLMRWSGLAAVDRSWSLIRFAAWVTSVWHHLWCEVL